MYIQHTVLEMNESMVQSCELCGAVICDYRTVLWPDNQPEPTGFAAGRLYVRKGFPVITTTIRPDDEAIELCTD